MRGQLSEIQRQKQINTRLKNENAKLRSDLKIAIAEIKTRDEKIAALGEKLEKAFLYIEELQKYVFRGKKKKDDDDKHDKLKGSSVGNRTGTSYRRAIPSEQEITDEQIRPIENCPHCQTKLTKLKILEFFEEDIAPMMEWHRSLKKVTRIKITTGYCPNCKKRFSSVPIPKQKVSLGKNIRQLIVFQCTIQQLSHSQMLDFLKSCLHLEISEGEIAHILAEQATKLKASYEDLLRSIQSEDAVHLDETGWKVAFNDAFSGNFTWVMAGVESSDVVYSFGKSRGGGNISPLLGDFNGIGITDGYTAYSNVFEKGKHALCWAHPDRKIRDLKNSESLSEKKKLHCKKVSDEFSELYAEVRKISASEFVQEERMKAKEILMEKFKKIVAPDKKDPSKLVAIKKSLLKQSKCYFVCIATPNIPTDNNKAERALRHLTIKRKKSFGSKTPKGAAIMSVLYSVVMSLWFRSKENFFVSYDEALS
jgi:hypothetical protein